MLARLTRSLPREGYLYEPKWDGFRSISFRDRGEIDMRSRHDRPLARYFPELVDALRAVPSESFVIDGEIVVVTERGFDFPATMARLHPAASRVERLARETPAQLIAFDLVSEGSDDLRETRFEERRVRLERLLSDPPDGLRLTPITDDAEVAQDWLSRFEGGGIDGVMAKRRDLHYQPGARAMTKVKNERRADCVVAGFRVYVDAEDEVASLLLGLYDDRRELEHVGVASSMRRELRLRLFDELRPLIVPLQGHPWEHGYLIGGGALGRLPGSAGRWTPDMEHDWIPVRPERVAEVAYEQLDDFRFRHPARFRRWRPDRDPLSCSIEQLRATPPPLITALEGR